MALNLILGPAGSGKTHSLFSYALKQANEHPEINYLVVVPEQYTLSTQKELVRMSDRKGILNVDVLSFARLSYRIFEEVGFSENTGVIMDDMGKNLILRYLAGKEDDNWGILNGKIKRLSYITEIKSLISEFKQYKLTEDDINKMIENAADGGKIQLANKLKDVNRLYGLFNEYIRDKYTTTEEILDLAARSAFRSEKLRKSVILFDGFTGFTPVQYGLIESLLQISRDIYITLLNDERDGLPYNTEHELFYLSYETKNKLKKIAERNNVCINKDVSLNRQIPCRYDNKITHLIHLEKNLFREYKRPYAYLGAAASNKEKPTKPVDAEMRVISALNPVEEVKNAAVMIKKLVFDKGLKYKDIAIATGDLETYSPIILREFRKYEIPVFTDRKTPILLNPFTEYIKSIIEIVTSNWQYEAVFRYLRSPLNDYETSDIDKLENFVLANGINTYSQWNTDWCKKYVRNSKKYSEAYISEINNIENLRKDILEQMGNINKLAADSKFRDVKTQTKSVNALNTELYGILRDNDVQKRLINLAENIKKTDDSFELERSNEFERVYNETILLMEKMSELLGDEKITLSEYGDILEAGFNEIRIGIIPSVTDYIQIGDVTRSRFEKIHTLFIVGANDGVIPKNNSSSGLISDMEREYLMESNDNIELSPSARMKSYTSQLYLYMLMTKPDQNLFISYSRLNCASETIKPSYIIGTLLELFPDLYVERDIFNKHDYIYNDETAMEYISENIESNDDLSRSILSYYYSKDEYRAQIAEMISSHFSIGIFEKSDAISKAISNVLYTTSLKGSVTRLERFAECAYRYFLEYGLSLKERRLFEFDAADMGSLFHESLENYSRALSENSESWVDLDKDKQEEYINSAIDKALTEGDFSAIYSNNRRKYAVNRVKRILERSVDVLSNHLKVGKFNPIDAEIEFSSMSNLKAFNFTLSETERMHLSGKIDRVDTYEDNEHLYIKVIDYKSGNKSFDLLEVYKGLSLQLVVYLNATKEMVSKKTDKEIVPAGILYYHVDDPLVESELSESDEEISNKIFSQLRMKGLINEEETIYRLMDDDFDKKSDVIPIILNKDKLPSKGSSVASTEEFKVISDFVEKKLCSLGRDILAGKIEAKPNSAKGTDEKKCSYCPYVTVCKYKPNDRDDDSDTEYNTSINKDEIIDLMKQELL